MMPIYFSFLVLLLIVSCGSHERQFDNNLGRTLDNNSVVFNNVKFKNIILVSVSGLRKDKLSWYGYNRATTPMLEQYLGRADVFNNHFSVSYHPYRSKQALLLSEYPELNNPYKNPGVSLNQQEVLTKRGIDSFLSQLRVNGFSVIPENNKNWIEAYNLENQKDLVKLKSEIKKIHSPFALSIGSNLLLTPNYFPPQVSSKEFMSDPYQGKLPKTREQFVKLLNQCQKNIKRCSNKYKIDSLEDSIGEPDFNYHFFNALVDPTKDEDLKQVNNLYDQSLFYLDSMLGELLNSLDERNLLEETLIVLTADTGSSLFDKHLLKIGRELNRYSGQFYFLEEIIKIPLVIGYKSKIKMLYAENAKQSLTNTTDVAPTILDILNVKKRESMQGINLNTYTNFRKTTYGASKSEHRGLEKYSTDGEFLHVSSETRPEMLTDMKTNLSYISSEFVRFQNIVEKLRLGIGVK